MVTLRVPPSSVGLTVQMRYPRSVLCCDQSFHHKRAFRHVRDEQDAICISKSGELEEIVDAVLMSIWAPASGDPLPGPRRLVRCKRRKHEIHVRVAPSAANTLLFTSRMCCRFLDQPPSRKRTAHRHLSECVIAVRVSAVELNGTLLPKTCTKEFAQASHSQRLPGQLQLRFRSM